MLCPVVIGRADQQAALRASLAAARAGHGATVALVADAGMGKSRLVREVAAHAAQQDLAVLAGRAVPSTAPVPLRPLSEVVLGAQRTGLDIRDPRLDGFAAHLARLLPDRHDGPLADASPVLLGEAFVRLLRLGADGRGCVVVLEDLHWADHETLAVLEYIADTVRGERVLLVITARDEGGPPAALLDRLRVRGAARVEMLGALDAAQQRLMISACLGGPLLASDVDGFVAAHTDGVPFLVEELLAGMAAAGALEHTPLGWRLVRAMTPAVPRSLHESVLARLRRLDPAGRRAVGAAATLGRQFDWDLLPGVAGLDGTAAVEAMRAAIAEQLIVVDGPGFRFRHALTREAVLAQLLPPERRAFSARALASVERAHPGLPGPWCELAAELAQAAGDGATAAARLVESAERALRRGAYATAANTSVRAVELAGDAAIARRAREVQVDALVQAGDAGGAEQIGAALVDDPSLPNDRRAAVHLLLARAAVAAGGTDRAVEHVRRARVADTGIFDAQLDAVAALVALDDERPTDAARLARAAVQRAKAAGQPEVECEALGVLGRLAGSLSDAVEIFERMRALAEQHALPTWRVLALQEIAVRRAATQGPAVIAEARQVAAELGSLVTVAQLDLMSAEMAFESFDRTTCREAAQRCVEVSRRFGLATLPVALLWLAGAHALADDEKAMSEALAESLALDPGDQRIAADSWGRVRATFCAVREDREGLRTALDKAMTLTRTAPASRSFYLGQMPWVVLHAAEDDDYGAAARAEIAGSQLMILPAGHVALSYAEAIAHGRQGRSADARRCYLTAREIMAGKPAGFFMGMLLDRFVAEAAIRDGWGAPGEWLREVEAFHAAHGYDRIARACRVLMMTAGAPAPRRGRGDSQVPPGLRGLGVTSRELDVLRLVRDGLGNRDIATRLHLSPRTVEHHIARLLRRTRTASRRDLAAVEIR
ncbi:MAG TPA: AAA family ATPase [Jatrophihabitans sp.]|nr:AAA family ATPase [Jatrophihabitans sp.]